MPKKPKPAERWKLAHPSYAFGDAQHRRGLLKGKERFHEIFNEEIGNSQRAPSELRKKWVVSEDFGMLRDLWMQGYQPNKKDIAAPIVGHDVIALQDRGAGKSEREPALFRSKEDVVDLLMHPSDAYAFPVPDKKGRHVATVIHVGPKASKKQIRRLVRSLINDPTGAESYRRMD